MPITANELLGEKTLELNNLHVEYTRLLLLLADVVSGKTAPDRVQVDLERRAWSLLPSDTPFDPHFEIE